MPVRFWLGAPLFLQGKDIMKKSLSEIFKELNKPDNKLKMLIRLRKEQKLREQKENESKPELSR